MRIYREKVNCYLAKIFTDVGIFYYLEKNGEQVARVEFCDDKNIDDLREREDDN